MGFHYRRWLAKQCSDRKLIVNGCKQHQTRIMNVFRVSAWKGMTCLGSRIYNCETAETARALAKRDFGECDHIYVTRVNRVYRGVNSNIG